MCLGDCVLFVTARKRSLGQDNVFTPVCHSVHRGGVASQHAPELGKVSGMHPTGMLSCFQSVDRVPTRTGKPGKMGRHFPVREKSGNFDQTGKVREKSGKITQNTGKLREFQTNIICYFLVISK